MHTKGFGPGSHELVSLGDALFFDHTYFRCFALEPFLKSIRVFSVVGLAVNSD